MDNHDPLPNVIPEHMRIRDIHHYLETRGLRNEPVGQESFLNVSENKQRILEESAHKERVFRSVFGTPEMENAEKNECLKKFEGSKMTLKTVDGSIQTDVKTMAIQCDTIYALASSYDLYNNNSSVLELSLDMYQRASVQEFVEMANGTKPVHDVSPNLVIECCQIAHYLQCDRVLTPIVEILVDAVDTENCRSLLELADRLNFPTLFERSLSQMMESLDGTDDVWDDLSHELRDRVTLMRKAVESSIIAGKSRLYFTSLVEYLALFAENVEYHRERLATAKERQAELLDEDRVRSCGWEYNQKKLEHQERRVHRLEIILEEQKRVFSEVSAVEGIATIRNRKDHETGKRH